MGQVVAEPAGEQEDVLMERNCDAAMETSFLVGSSGKENFVYHETQGDAVEMMYQMPLVILFENPHRDALHHLALDKENHFLAAYTGLCHSF